MAIENVQYVYVHKRLYRTASRHVNNQFFMLLETKQQIETKNSFKIFKKTLSKPKGHIWPLKISSNEPFSNAKNVVQAFSLMRIGKN